MMKQKMKTIMRITFSNGITLLYFEIFYKLLGFVFVFPLLQNIFFNVLNILGTSYLSQENIILIVKDWRSVLTLAAALFLLVLYLYFEIVAHISYCEIGWKRETCSLWKLCKISFFRSIKIFHYKNILLLMLLPFIALSIFPITGWLLQSAQIPEFIMDYIIGNPFIFVSFVLGIIVINIVLFFFLFGIPSMVIMGESFFDSWKFSIDLLRGNKKETIKTVLFCLITFLLCTMLLTLGIIFIMVLYAKHFYSEDAVSFFQQIYTAWSRIGSIVFATFRMLILIASVVTLFYKYLDEEELESVRVNWTIIKIFKQGLLIVGIFLIIGIFSETEMAGVVLYSSKENPMVVAHRGGASFALENTLEALRQAINDGADMAEIDVQQTKDGTLIIIHDTSFKRVAGVNKNVWDTDYKEVKNFNAADYVANHPKIEPIPTLEQMLFQAKDKIQLMIELKVTGHETDLEHKTIELIKENGMEKQSVICSMNLETLKKVKQLDSNIKTVYITAVLIADKYDLSYIDGYSVETSFLSSEMVYNAHSQNKKIYAWTANSEDSINKVISTNADGIITDNVSLAYYCIETKGQDLTLEFLIDLFFKRESEPI